MSDGDGSVLKVKLSCSWVGGLTILNTGLVLLEFIEKVTTLYSQQEVVQLYKGPRALIYS